MGGSQVPVWVPIVVGALGLLGVLTTQAISMWQERRRLEDRQAERLDGAEREDRSWHREQRLQLYGEIIAELHILDEALWSLHRRHFEAGYEDSSGEVGRIEAVLSDYRRDVGKLEVVGSNKVSAPAVRLTSIALEICVIQIEAVRGVGQIADSYGLYETRMAQFKEVHDSLLVAMRRDLRVRDD